MFCCFFFLKILFLSHLYPQGGARTHNPQSTSHVLFRPSQPAAPALYVFEIKFTYRPVCRVKSDGPVVADHEQACAAVGVFILTVSSPREDTRAP